MTEIPGETLRNYVLDGQWRQLSSQIVLEIKLDNGNVRNVWEIRTHHLAGFCCSIGFMDLSFGNHGYVVGIQM